MEALCSSEFLCYVIERAAFCLRKANPREGQGEQGRSHEEEVDVRSTDFLWETDGNTFIWP